MVATVGRVLSQVVGLVAVGALLVGCSDDKGPDIDPTTALSLSTSPSAVEASVSQLPVPAGVELTAQGSQLAVGATATVAYQPRQDLVGVLDITVTRLEKTSFKKSFSGWELDDQQKKANPYFVRATVTNSGESDLGGRRVPLYIVDGTNTLIESTTFASSFRPCEPGSFPKKYPAGKEVQVCLVFLSPGKGELTAVSFRPSQEFDPITWTGTLEKPQKPAQGGGSSASPSESPSS